MNSYKVLGIEQGADAAQARKAYHALVKKWHPDRHRGLSTEAEAHERMAEINSAYAEIKNGASALLVQATGQTERPHSDTWEFDDKWLQRQARMLMFQNRYREAMALLRQCKIRSAEWYEMMGVCRAKIGDRQGAEDSFRWARRRAKRTVYRRRRSVSWWRRAIWRIRALLRGILRM